jgi:hypothetical protein
MECVDERFEIVAGDGAHVTVHPEDAASEFHVAPHS